MDNQYDLVLKAIQENIKESRNNYEQWRHERFEKLQIMANIADDELDRRRMRKRRKIEGW